MKAIALPTADNWAEFSKQAAPLLNWHLWVEPGFYVLLGIGSGLLVEKLLLGSLRRILSRMSFELNQQLENTLRGVIMGIFTLWGLHAATYSIHFLRDDVLENIRKLLFVAAMFLGIQVISKILVAIARFYLNRSQGAQALPGTSLFENIIKILIYLLGAMMIMQTMGVSVTPLITALGVGGLAISLSLQDTLANMFAGINMLLARQIKVGDMVQIESGLTGRVEDIGWRTTILRQNSNNLVILPNTKLASAVLVSFTQPHPDLTVTMTIPVPPDRDFDQMELMVYGVAEEVGKRLLSEKMPARGNKTVKFTPIVRFASYGESWINMDILLPFPVIMDGGAVKHAVLKAVHTRFQKEGVRAPYSFRSLSLANAPASEPSANASVLQSAAATILDAKTIPGKVSPNGHGETEAPA